MKPVPALFADIPSFLEQILGFDGFASFLRTGTFAFLAVGVHLVHHFLAEAMDNQRRSALDLECRRLKVRRFNGYFMGFCHFVHGVYVFTKAMGIGSFVG